MFKDESDLLQTMILDDELYVIPAVHTVGIKSIQLHIVVNAKLSEVTKSNEFN